MLKPLKVATKVFEHQNKPTSNRVAEEIFDIIEQLKEVVDDEEVHPTARLFAKILMQSTRRRFPDLGVG